MARFDTELLFDPDQTGPQFVDFLGVAQPGDLSASSCLVGISLRIAADLAKASAISLRSWPRSSLLAMPPRGMV